MNSKRLTNKISYDKELQKNEKFIFIHRRKIIIQNANFFASNVLE